MLVNHSNSATIIYRFPVLIIAGIIFSSSALSYADKIPAHETAQFDRADVETIKMHTRQILSDPDFAPNKTFWQWLSEKFSKWEGPKFDLGPRWATFILSVVIIWCILALIAILVHFIWTIRLLIWSRGNTSGARSGSGPESLNITSFEELYKTAQELAGKGAFREAMRIMIVALLRWLDSMGVVRFHESKTNGDYVREYPAGHAGRNEFKRFVLIFEQIIYGGLHSGGQTYQQMDSLMERILNRVIGKA